MATFEISIFKIQISKYPFLESPRIIQIRFVKSTGEKWFKVFLSRHRQAMAGPLAALFLQHYHQTLQVPKMEVFADLSCICKAYVEKTHTQNSLIRLSTSIFWYPKLLVTLPLLKLCWWRSIVSKAISFITTWTTAPFVGGGCSSVVAVFFLMFQ